MDKQLETIDITPTFAGMMPFYINVLESPRAGKGAKDLVRAELMRMARHLDKINGQTKDKTGPRWVFPK